MKREIHFRMGKGRLREAKKALGGQAIVDACRVLGMTDEEIKAKLCVHQWYDPDGDICCALCGLVLYDLPPEARQSEMDKWTKRIQSTKEAM